MQNSLAWLVECSMKFQLDTWADVQIGDLRGVAGLAIAVLTQLFPWIFEQPDEYLNYQLGNTSVAYHGNRILTLMEGGLPFEAKLDVTGNVHSVGVFDYDGVLKRPITGHPKVDPHTGEMVTFFHRCASVWQFAQCSCTFLLFSSPLL